MSIHKLHLSVFRFDAKRDYNPAYEKCDFEYDPESLLSNVLESLPLRDLAYDKTIALKINQIAVFEDLSVSDLVVRFGKEWVLEPISIKYAFKDLCIDKQAVLGFYQRFLDGGDFLSATEKAELTKFLNINFISPQRNPDYFGDGFFLYVKWLFMRHPKEAKRLLESIAEPKNGVMNFVSVKHFVYPESDGIDKEIFEIQKMLTQASKCPFAGNSWSKFSQNVDSKYQFAPALPPQKSSELTYAIFNGYEKGWNTAPLLRSAKILLEKMGLKTLDLHFCFDGGYWGRLCDLEKFLLANAYNLALAQHNGAVLLCCDEDAYINALYAKKILDSDESADQQVLESINKKLKSYGLSYERTSSNNAGVKYLNEMIANELKYDVIQSFEGFETLLFHGSLFGFSSDGIDKICYDEMFKKISLKHHQASVQNESYAHLFDVFKPSALKQSGAIYYEAIDLGVDFLLTTSLGQFEMLDTHAKKASKAYRRDFDSTPTLFLSELVLLAMGERDSQKIGLHLHKNRVGFI
ncbi:DUF5644 domain-containing protein [Helicobacter sp. 11S02596-1]|uniref:DUF5644 domain-containing protein n=1 Tax=Helicobacter sp. 11S02596-1 TaxID=1476194 RepID=UPI000BA604EE|nr:DUF5644 domain-containing protein [Helicobacter sp. 11S02596-1]PAF42490.1 hypothetical protein BJI48_06740 [Helicobacter sp. 11S02596-1]